jgi:glycosyltransferase involved in cell wall biosynthesis
MNDPGLSVVVPVYRSEETVGQLVSRLFDVLEATGREFELVLIEDGSPDRSWEVLTELAARYGERIVAVQLMRNYGQHNALMCGFRIARGAIVVTMDDDLQHPPEAVPDLVAALEARGLDLVYGTYTIKEHASWRNAGSGLVTMFYRLVFQTTVTPSAFRAIRRELVQATLTYDLNFTYIDGLLAWNTRRIGEVAVPHHPRAAGRSGYSVGKLLGLALNLFTNFSLLPLQLVSASGIVAAGGGFVLGAYYLCEYVRSNIDVPGYASIIVAVLVLGGIQLLSLGIMGEYLGRLHLNVNRKPQYHVRQVVGSKAEGHASAESGEPRRDPSQPIALRPEY